MHTIASENLKQIRHPLEVYVNIYQKTGINLDIAQTGAAVADLSSLQTQEIDLANLTDLSGAGFPLDGSCRLYDPADVATVETGKTGIRTTIGGAVILNISAESEIPAVTLKLKGNGTITADSGVYEARSFIVIPVNATSATMTLQAAANERLEVDDLTAGVTLELTNENLISVSLDLESDLNVIDQNWNVSSIDVTAGWPDDISDAVSGMGDGVPIIYYSGYPGDYSKPRYFYLSEEVTQKNGIITIHGEDASTALDRVNINDLLWAQTRQNARKGIYEHMKKTINAAGINLAETETDPPNVGTNSATHYIGINECTGRDLLAYIMGMIGAEGFYPRFIDAGIPTLRWQTPASSWTINEADVADHERKTERKINKIVSESEETPLQTLLTLSAKRETIETKNVTAGKTYSINYNENRYTDIKIKNGMGTIVKQSLSGLTVKANKTTEKITKMVLTGYKSYEKKYNTNTQSAVITEPPKVIDGYKTNLKKKKSGNYIIYTWREPIFSKRTEYLNQLIVTGKRVNVPNAVQPGEDFLTYYELATPRVGITVETNPLFLGQFRVNKAGGYYLVPDYKDIFTKSNKTGQFTFYGNPHIQPRDVFTFNRLDGSSITATVQSVSLEHEGGGLISTITYREGIL